MISMVAAAILAVVPGDSILRDRVDLIEFNVVYHVTDIEGEPPKITHTMAQMVFWRQQNYRHDGRTFRGLRVCDYQVFPSSVFKEGPVSRIVPDFPRVRRRNGRCVITWCDYKQTNDDGEKIGVWREVSAQACLWTLTTYDPDASDTWLLPRSYRQKLRRPKWPTPKKRSSSPVERNPNWMR